MIQGLQMLCGVVLLAVITVGQTWGAEAIDIRLQSGTPLEDAGATNCAACCTRMTCTRGSLHATS
jgi:hypothetical protein